ncbi:MAG: TerB family tellurite resistance protein [Hyphomonadaceae bacterium]|nr:TerB family tellurite resistance protein [Hyphomonadaceae bacterium]MBX3511262.1 TerB family tellurite resistance protein [Hyphomonadaceae bacterium]
MLWLSTASAPASASNEGGGQAALALLVLIVIVIAWIGLRSAVRRLRAGKTQRATGGRYADYVREVLANAARLDGRVSDAEASAIAAALAEATGAAPSPGEVESTLRAARLSKEELVAFLAARSNQFSHEQKVALLKALLAVFVADGAFDESEHAALVDYTAAVGFDRQSAPQMLAAIARDFRQGRIT